MIIIKKQVRFGSHADLDPNNSLENVIQRRKREKREAGVRVSTNGVTALKVSCPYLFHHSTSSQFSQKRSFIYLMLVIFCCSVCDLIPSDMEISLHHSLRRRLPSFSERERVNCGLPVPTERERYIISVSVMEEDIGSRKDLEVNL